MYYDNSVQFYNHVRFCLHHSIRTYLCKCVRNNCIQDLMASTTDWYLFDKSVYCNIYIKLSSGNTCFGYVLWHVSSRPFRWAAIIWPWITSHSLLRAFLSAKIFCWNQLNISIQGNITIQLNVCFKEIALQKESNFDVTSFDVIFRISWVAYAKRPYTRNETFFKCTVFVAGNVFQKFFISRCSIVLACRVK